MPLPHSPTPRLSFAQMLVRAQRRFVAARQAMEAARPSAALSLAAGRAPNQRTGRAAAGRSAPVLA
jgi:hypothetical protein